MDQSQNPSNPTQTPPPNAGQSTPAPSAPPTQTPAAPATPSNPTPTNSTPPTSQTPPPAGNKSKKGLVIAIIVFLVLLAGAAALLFTQNPAVQTEQTVVPTTSVENNEAPTTAPTQSVEQEVDAVDTGATESSDLKEVEEEINTLH
jgi:uncharacterized protein HemX